jgi:hypothetical protein
VYPIPDIDPYERYIYMEVYMQQSILHDFLAPRSVFMIRLFALLCYKLENAAIIEIFHTQIKISM